VTVDAQIFEGLQDLAGGPIDLFDGISVSLICTFAAEVVAGMDGIVGHGVGQIDQEGMVLVDFDEVDSFVSVAHGDGVLIDGGFDDCFVSKQRQGWIGLSLVGTHVVAVRDAVIIIEALTGGQKLWLIAQMPLADTGGGVVFLFEDFGDGDFVGMKTLFADRKQDGLVFGVLVHIDPARVAAGHQAGTGRRANAAGDVKAGEACALFGHAVDVGSPVFFGAETSQVPVAEIVAKDNDEIGRSLRIRF